MVTHHSDTSRRNKYILGALAVLCLFAIFSLHNSNSNIYVTPSINTDTPKASNMGIMHIVMFEFKKDARFEDVKDVRHNRAY